MDLMIQKATMHLKGGYPRRREREGLAKYLGLIPLDYCISFGLFPEKGMSLYRYIVMLIVLL